MLIWSAIYYSIALFCLCQGYISKFVLFFISNSNWYDIIYFVYVSPFSFPITQNIGLLLYQSNKLACLYHQRSIAYSQVLQVLKVSMAQIAELWDGKWIEKHLSKKLW